MKTLKVPRESSLFDTAAASLSGDFTDVMGSDWLWAPADLPRHSTPYFTGKSFPLFVVFVLSAGLFAQRRQPDACALEPAVGGKALSGDVPRS